jgi:hypothetical protein
MDPNLSSQLKISLKRRPSEMRRSKVGAMTNVGMKPPDG